MPLYVPAASPVLGRTLMLLELPAVIEDNGDDMISKYVPPVVMLAPTVVSVTDPVLLIVTDCAVCAPYPAFVDWNTILVGLIENRGADPMYHSCEGEPVKVVIIGEEAPFAVKTLPLECLVTILYRLLPYGSNHHV